MGAETWERWQFHLRFVVTTSRDVSLQSAWDQTKGWGQNETRVNKYDLPPKVS